jgi:hypothetical protein
MGIPLSAPIFKKEDLQGENLDFFNQWMTTIAQAINAQQGTAGPVKLQGHLDLQGNRIMNVGKPVDDTDAVSQAVATTQFGAAALQPQIEALGKHVLQTARRLNDRIQRENHSSFLNKLVSTSPTTNDSTVSFAAPVGGTVDVTVSGGHHFYVDGSQVSYTSRTDTLALPAPFTVVAVTRAGNSVTLQTSAPNPFIAGETIAVAGVSDASFDGAFAITAVTDPTHFSYAQNAPGASSSGGTVSLGGVFYYYLEQGSTVLGLTNNPFGSGDSQRNRLQSSVDGQVLIAVVALNSPAGGDMANSAAGGTAPVNNALIHILTRI